ncbi:metallophosphoesterase [Pseudomonas sp. FP597]|uniref:metallophosphoesterase family protein n=1 Tax=Pseudomonas sp. FP597 TaxID=2954096 RepID=UPI00273621F4|nr:metallophosphoesterase [Pseudomonas sp. FP597]WLI08020.1 metallophosphoesterase [Pseudomonas sp. FP597]
MSQLRSMKVAVISDLHIGDMAKGKDFSPDRTENASVENYLQEFHDFVLKENIGADYLLVSGDISNRAKEQEFALASELIEKIARSLTVSREKILFCPGNHDINWAALQSGGEDFDHLVRAKYLNFLKGGLLFSDNQGSGVGRFDVSPYVVVWSFDDINIFALNSAVYDGPDENPHRGEIKSEQIVAIDELLSKYVDRSKINIFVLHHHPKQYQDKTFRAADKSCMINADGLLHLLSKHEVDFVVHGHKHVPRFDLEINSEGHPIWILCAGSFSSRLDDRYFGGVGNFFHLVDFRDRCGDNGWARGYVKSWAHLLAHNWIESGTIDFDSHNQFGAYESPKKLNKILEDILGEVFENAHMARWSDLVEKNESLQYYPNVLLNNQLEKAAKKVGVLMVYQGEQKALDKLILVKDKVR